MIKLQYLPMRMVKNGCTRDSITERASLKKYTNVIQSGHIIGISLTVESISSHRAYCTIGTTTNLYQILLSQILDMSICLQLGTTRKYRLSTSRQRCAVFVEMLSDCLSASCHPIKQQSHY